MATLPDPAPILARLERFGIRLGLGTVRRLLELVGEPQRELPAVLVAGTNGKGSTAALLASVLAAAGHRTGLYTSPHLERVEERIRVDGRAIAGDELGRHLARVVALAEDELGHPPTYFEAVTVAALLHFRSAGVGLAVLETGMGGRLDATNAAEPVLSLVTDISLEHREQLGDDTATIAREKAGILRPGRPALAAVRDPEARAALAGVAAERGARLAWLEERVEVAGRRDLGLAGQHLRLATATRDYDLRLRLPGEHMARNATLAVAAAEELALAGWGGVDRAAVERGVAACRWPGRLEAVELPDGGRVVLDSAHNPGAVAALVRFLDEHLDRPWDLLFGVLADKEAAAMLPPLAERARRVVLTAPVGGRALPPERLAGLVPERAGAAAEVVPELEEALERALTAADRAPLVVTGSIYLVGAVRSSLRRRFGAPTDRP